MRSVKDLGGTLCLAQAADGLGASLEIVDLLNYIANDILHFASAYTRHAREKLVHPCLTQACHWHMSWQGGWVRKQRRSAPDT